LIVGEELETKHRLIGLGSISNEERRFTIVGTISSRPINNIYDKEHSPCNTTLSCPMPHLQQLSTTSTKHHTPNDTMDPFGKLTSMVQVEEGVVDLNEWRNKYFKSLATNHISCSTPRKEDEVPFIATKRNANKLLCMYIQVLFCSLVFLWGSFALCHFS
jgi:hypothetical protein